MGQEGAWGASAQGGGGWAVSFLAPTAHGPSLVTPCLGVDTSPTPFLFSPVQGVGCPCLCAPKGQGSGVSSPTHSITTQNFLAPPPRSVLWPPGLTASVGHYHFIIL